SAAHPSRALCPAPSFPTRRSSDLRGEEGLCLPLAEHADFPVVHSHPVGAVLVPGRLGRASLTCAGLWGIITHNAFGGAPLGGDRSEEHTSELQSRFELVCRLLPEK